jgi:hypothetical protein
MYYSGPSVCLLYSLSSFCQATALRKQYVAVQASLPFNREFSSSCMEGLRSDATPDILPSLDMTVTSPADTREQCTRLFLADS